MYALYCSLLAIFIYIYNMKKSSAQIGVLSLLASCQDNNQIQNLKILYPQIIANLP